MPTMPAFLLAAEELARRAERAIELRRSVADIVVEESV